MRDRLYTLIIIIGVFNGTIGMVLSFWAFLQFEDAGFLVVSVVCMVFVSMIIFGQLMLRKLDRNWKERLKKKPASLNDSESGTKPFECKCGFTDYTKHVRCPKCGTVHNEEKYVKILELQHKMGLNR